MKSWKFLAATVFCAAGALVFTSCSDDDDDPQPLSVPAAVRTSLEGKYGPIAQVEWEREGAYFVAEFRKDGREHEVWFDRGSSSWIMSEVDCGRSLANLPEAVRAGFEATAYAQAPWVVEDIDYVDRNGYAAAYRIEVESYDDREAGLLFDENGTLVREWSDGGHHSGPDGGLVPSPVPETIGAFLAERYPEARIVELDREDGRYYEVDLVQGLRSIEARFALDGEWLSSRTELPLSQVPQAVLRAAQERFPGCRPDDAEWIETPSGDFYLIELDDMDFNLKVSADGASVDVVPD